MYLWGISCLKALLMQILIYIISRNVFLLKVNDLFYSVTLQCAFFFLLIFLYVEKKIMEKILARPSFFTCVRMTIIVENDVCHVSESHPSWIFWYYKLKNIRSFFLNYRKKKQSQTELISFKMHVYMYMCILFHTCNKNIRSFFFF